MASTNDWYAHAILNALQGNFDLENDTIKASLHTDAYTPSKNMHEHFNDATNEVEATGYTAGGQELTNKTLSIVGNKITFDADDPEWTISGSLTYRYIVVRVDLGDPELDILLGFIDRGENKTTTDNILKPVFNVEGILQGTC